MSSDYIPRLRQELLRVGATKPSRLRWAHPARALRPLAGAAAVALVVVAVVLAFPRSERATEPAANTIELSYRVDPSEAASTERVIRDRLAAAGVRGAGVSVAGGSLAITAPPAARADVTALAQSGRFAIYDWERSMLGPRGEPAPGDASVTGGQDAGRAAATSKAEAGKRAADGQAVRALGAQATAGSPLAARPR